MAAWARSLGRQEIDPGQRYRVPFPGDCLASYPQDFLPQEEVDRPMLGTAHIADYDRCRDRVRDACARPLITRFCAQLPAGRILDVITCYAHFTCTSSASGVIVMSNQNITLSLPEEDLREARILAASRGTSVSQLLARMLRELVDQETGYARARDRSLAGLREGTDLGTGGHIGWSRDSVHER
jgi:hypothetical protein